MLLTKIKKKDPIGAKGLYYKNTKWDKQVSVVMWFAPRPPGFESHRSTEIL